MGYQPIVLVIPASGVFVVDFYVELARAFLESFVGKSEFLDWDWTLEDMMAKALRWG